jgi:hypothetical protein
MYCKDGLELYHQMIQNTDCEPNIQILNSLTYLFCSALKVDELEQKILPLYAKNRIQYDVYTYMNISKMYLDLRRLDECIALMAKFRETGMKPNKILLNTVLEVGLRKESTNVVYDAL